LIGAGWTIAGRKLARDTVIAAVVRLLDLGHIRVGNEAYAKSNKSFGATTLRNRHAKVHGARVTALYVVDPYPYLGIGESNPLGLQAYMSAALEHAADAHGKVQALCERAGVPFQPHLAEDVTAANGILQTARQTEADLVVVGSHGRTGIDIAGVSHVINYDVPEHPEDYVHRIGRTGRAQNVGDAFTLMNGEELASLQAIERFMGQKIPRLKLENFPYLYTALFEPELLEQHD